MGEETSCGEDEQGNSDNVREEGDGCDGQHPVDDGDHDRLNDADLPGDAVQSNLHQACCCCCCCWCWSCHDDQTTSNNSRFRLTLMKIQNFKIQKKVALCITTAHHVSRIKYFYILLI